MEDLLNISERLISRVSMDFKRYLFPQVNWDNRLIGLKGARGSGKTTLLLQRLKQLRLSGERVAYFSLDELYFSTNSLLETARTFYQQGGKMLALDEVHKYPTWSKEIKNLYDRYEDLKIIFTGSSIIDISRQEGDLSRRAVMHELKGLSYREYLELQFGHSLPAIDLEMLLSKGANIRKLFPTDFKPLAHFHEYLRYGYYPFYKADKPGYYLRLRQLVRTIVEYDMAELKGFDIRHAKKMLQLLYVIAQQVPFKPNIQSLAQKTGIHRNSINNYLYFLHEARLIHLLYPSGISMATLQRPEKIYLENTNLLYALSEQAPSSGNLRETFFANQTSARYPIQHAAQTDFVVNHTLSFEIGGKGKSQKQISGLKDAWVVKDDMEYPAGGGIPLWIFGFLY